MVIVVIAVLQVSLRQQGLFGTLVVVPFRLFEWMEKIPDGRTPSAAVTRLMICCTTAIEEDMITKAASYTSTKKGGRRKSHSRNERQRGAHGGNSDIGRTSLRRQCDLFRHGSGLPKIIVPQISKSYTGLCTSVMVSRKQGTAGRHTRPWLSEIAMSGRKETTLAS